jgi:hypothetical protein
VSTSTAGLGCRRRLARGKKKLDPALDQSEVRISRTGGQSEFLSFL